MSTATLNKSSKQRIPVSFALPDPPPLENGEHLSRDEFHRRYLAMPHLKKAELIEGIVIMGSPVSAAHANAHGILGGILFHYATATPGIGYGDNATIRLDPDNEVQPDAMLRIEPAAGGRSRLAKDGYYDDPPEFIAEVAVSSGSYDFHEKLKAYRRNRVPEYLIWQPASRRVEWLRIKGGDYALISPRADGLICSQVFPGLWIDADALISGKVQKVLSQLDKGLRSAEHGAFVKKLAGK